VVTGDDGAEHLVPATRDAVAAVDLEAGRVSVKSWVFDIEEVR
jgi:ribosomal 30S subunit maturation factor RimM